MKERTLVLGLVCSMVASQVWQLTATYLTWPVSGTHTIISALMGFTLVENGSEGINVGNPNIFEGSGVFKVIYGLLVSPALTFVLSFCFYYFLYKTTVVENNLGAWKSKITITFSVFLTFLAIGFTASSMPAVPVPSTIHRKLFGLLIGLAVGLVASLLFLFLLFPFLLRTKKDPVIKLDRRLSRLASITSKEDRRLSRLASITSKEEVTEEKKEEPEEDFVDESEDVKRMFRPLQLLTACFGALSHGSNDVGNCIGPLVTVWYIFQTPVNYSTDTTLYGVLLWGGIGISLGMTCCGSRVIQTMGSRISRMTPSLGFTVVLTASIVVMVCSMAGIPTSTTHCQVMGVVGAGIAKGWVDKGSLREGVKTINFSLMSNIGISWLATIPFAMALSSLTYWIAQAIFIGSTRLS